MSYRIIIEYTTGNSFGTHDETGYVEYTWENVEMAKENLLRIKQHYDWYRDKESYSFQQKGIEKPECADDEYDFRIKLKMDDGREIIYGTFWIGHFERLNSARIELDLPEIRF